MIADIHYSKPYEQAVLGACLLEPSGFAKIYNRLHADIFYFTGHQIVFTCLQEMFTQNIPIDLLTTHDFIIREKQQPFISNWNTAYFLTRLTQHVINDHHIDYHSLVLQKMWAERELITLTSSGPKPVEEIERTLKTIKPFMNTKSKLPYKVRKFLVRYIDKPLIRETVHLYGQKFIAGIKGSVIKVDSPLLVYFMHLIDPRYSYTCQGPFDEYLSSDRCKAMIPDNALLSQEGQQRMWIDRQGRYPKSFDL